MQSKGRRIIREPERQSITGIPRSTWHVLSKKGLTPEPVPLTNQTKGWVEEELYEFNEQRIAERDIG